MNKFKVESGDWARYRELPNIIEVDFHFEETIGSFWENMEDARNRSLNAIKTAYENGKINYVMFRHGWSTSGRGTTSSRSVVRGLMRHKDATPFIDRKNCIQHYSVFLAAIKEKEV